MKVIRTFVAVLIDDDLRRRIAGVQDQLKRLAPDVKWVAPENLHVTMKFLGDVREDMLPDVFAAVEKAAGGFSPFDVSVSGLGAFPSPSRARVVWVGLGDGWEQLRDLASAVEANLAALGFAREDKEFKAHITIGRVKFSRFLDRLAEGFGEVESGGLGVQSVASIAVMRSELRPSGPVYTPLKMIPLS